MKKLALALLLFLLAVNASAQIGTPPGISGGQTGGTITSPLKGASGCTTPPYSFLADTDSGLCLGAANNLTLQTAASGNARSYHNMTTTTNGLYFFDATGFDAQLRLYDNTIDFAAAGVTQAFIDGALAEFRMGYTTKDPIAIRPAAAGGGAFKGIITTADLDGERTFTFPNLSGNVMLLGGTGQNTTLTTGFNVTDGVDLAGSLWLGQTVTYLQTSSVTGGGTGYVSLGADTASLRTYSSLAPNFDSRLELSFANPYWKAQNTDGDYRSQISMTNANDQSQSLYLEVKASGVGDSIVRMYANGLLVSGLAAGQPDQVTFGVWRTMIQGGYTLDGTTTASPASTVTITLADPEADSAPTTSVQVCGYTTAANQTDGIKTCSTVAAVEGSVASASSFVTVTNIKASGKAGDDPDDTFLAEFTTGPVSIRSATAITDHAKSDFTASVPNGKEYEFNYFELSCLDVQGCDLTLSESSAENGHELTLALLSGTTNIVFVDSDGVMELAGDANDTLNALDVIRFIYSSNNSAWLQTSLSEN